MSEEIKSLKNYISTTKNEIFTTFKIETISNLIIYYEDLQQKVEQLEKENEQLRTQVNAYENPDDLTSFYMWLDEKAKDKIKQLENIRKEAIDFIEWHYKDNKEFFKNKGIGLNYPECDALLNILSKGE